MKKSDIFNKRFPSPLDKDVYPIYEEYTVLQSEILSNWQQDIVAQRIGMRDFIDFASSRIQVSINSKSMITSPVISLKPFIGIDVQDELDFYAFFFSLYSHYVQTVVKMMRRCVAGEVMEGLWTHVDNAKMHRLILLARVIIQAKKNGDLQVEHLIDLVKERDPKVLDEMLLNLNVDNLLNDTDGSHQKVVSAFWKYARKLNEINPGVVDALNEARKLVPKSHVILPVEVAETLIDAANRAHLPAFEGSTIAVANAQNAAAVAAHTIARLRAT